MFQKGLERGKSDDPRAEFMKSAEYLSHNIRSGFEEELALKIQMQALLAERSGTPFETWLFENNGHNREAFGSAWDGEENKPLRELAQKDREAALAELEKRMAQ